MLTPLGTKEDDEQHQTSPTNYYYPSTSQHYYCPVPYPNESYSYYSHSHPHHQVVEEDFNHPPTSSSSYYTTNYHYPTDETFYSQQKIQPITPTYDYNVSPVSSNTVFHPTPSYLPSPMEQNNNEYPSPYVSFYHFIEYFSIFNLRFSVTIEWHITFGFDRCWIGKSTFMDEIFSSYIRKYYHEK